MPTPATPRGCGGTHLVGRDAPGRAAGPAIRQTGSAEAFPAAMRLGWRRDR